MKPMKLNIQLFAASLYISAYETDINIENNTSYVQLSISVSTSGQTFNNTGSAYVNATLTGQNNTYSIPKTNFNIGMNTTKTVYSGKIGPFVHNSDGSLNPININASSYVTSNFSPSSSSTCDMSTIARKSTITATSAEIEGTSVITINKQSGSFYHSLSYDFYGLTGSIAYNTYNNYVNFTIPSSFYSKIPNGKSGVCTIWCSTYSNGTDLGSTSTTINVNCNEGKCRPSLSATLIDINEATKALTGDENILIKYKSTARITPTSFAKNSATISKITVDNNVVNNYIDFYNVNRNSFNIVSTDSRGFSSYLTKTAQLIDYVQLTCSAKFFRENQTSSIVKLLYSGNYFNGSFGLAENTLKMSWKYREKGNSEWIDGGELTPTISENKYSGEIKCGEEFDYRKNYEFIVYFADKLDNLNTGTILVNKGQGSFEIYDKALKADGKILFEWLEGLKLGSGILDLIYPVGSIYISINNTNPSNYFGGTWESFGNGRTLVGVDASQSEFNTVQKTGGSKYLQSHSHYFSGYTNTTGEHTHNMGAVRQYMEYGGSPWVANGASNYAKEFANVTSSGNHNHSFEGYTSNSGTGNSQNLQPYITVYMWKRIS